MLLLCQYFLFLAEYYSAVWPYRHLTVFVGDTVGVLALWSRTVRFGYFAGIAEQRLELGQDCVL